jgi:hypothetical protein
MASKDFQASANFPKNISGGFERFQWVATVDLRSVGVLANVGGSPPSIKQPRKYTSNILKKQKLPTSDDVVAHATSAWTRRSDGGA